MIKTLNRIRAPVHVASLFRKPDNSKENDDPLDPLPPLKTTKKKRVQALDTNYNRSCRPNYVLLPLDQADHPLFDIPALSSHPLVRLESHPMRTRTNFTKDFFGGESCLVHSAQKSMIKTAFPNLPHNFSTIDYSSTKGGSVKSTLCSRVVQSLKKSPVSVVANGETVKVLIIASPDFAKHCTVELARLVGSRVLSEGGSRACGLISLGNSDALDDGPLSIARLENSFLIQQEWDKAKMKASRDVIRRRDLDREELRRRRGVI
jgi:hypothetical protein